MMFKQPADALLELYKQLFGPLIISVYVRLWLSKTSPTELAWTRHS